MSLSCWLCLLGGGALGLGLVLLVVGIAMNQALKAAQDWSDRP